MTDHLRWTAEFIRSLYKNGVRHAVISPGSRSTPLTLAAAIHPGIEKKIVLDERSAGFMALGFAKNSGFPAILICTSGTALANYFPAVVEARQSGIPLIILSADRPPVLRAIGSSQTIDQIKIFGDYVHFFHEAGEPVQETQDLKRIDYLGNQAVEKSIDHSGPVHINLPFRKPLEPAQRVLNEETEKCILQFESLKDTERESAFRRTITPGNKIVNLLNGSAKPLVISGPSGPAQGTGTDQHIQMVSQRLNAPVIAEPGSAMGDFEHLIQRYEQFLLNSDNQKTLQPDLIVRFGNQPYTKSLLSALQQWNDVPQIHFNVNSSTQDHALSSSEKMVLKGNDQLDFSEVKTGQKSKWTGLWSEMENNANSKLDQALQNAEHLTDGHIARYISDELNADWNLMISNSFTVRDMALFGHAAKRQFVNRGSAGIDGILSTALGILAESCKPTCALIGDLAFYHDSNALLSLSSFETTPLLTVIINNGGGTIFRMLPVYDSEEMKIPASMYNTYFETPQSTNIRLLAEAASASYIRVSDIDQLNQLNLNQISTHTIIECVTNADQTMNLRKQLWSG